MTKDVYDQINEFCTKKYEGMLMQAEKDYVLRTFMDSYYSSLNTFKLKNNREPTITDEQIILETLLNDQTLLSYIIASRGYYEKFRTGIEGECRKNNDKLNFWKSIGTSLIANLAYSIILILLFWIAQDQLRTWLTQLLG